MTATTTTTERTKEKKRNARRGAERPEDAGSADGLRYVTRERKRKMGRDARGIIQEGPAESGAEVLLEMECQVRPLPC